MTFVKPPLDFTVVREDWCRYDLADNAILKVKTILTRIHKDQSKHSATFKNLVVVLTNEHGTPDPNKYSPQELLSSIIADDIRFTTISQDWNDYLADDGTRIKIQPIVMRVAKTSKFDIRGEPVYWVETEATVQIKPQAASP